MFRQEIQNIENKIISNKQFDIIGDDDFGNLLSNYLLYYNSSGIVSANENQFKNDTFHLFNILHKYFNDGTLEEEFDKEFQENKDDKEFIEEFQEFKKLLDKLNYIKSNIYNIDFTSDTNNEFTYSFKFIIDYLTKKNNDINELNNSMKDLSDKLILLHNRLQQVL